MSSVSGIEVEIKNLVESYIEQQYPQDTKILDVNYFTGDTTIRFIIEEPTKENEDGE